MIFNVKEVIKRLDKLSFRFELNVQVQMTLKSS